MMLLIKVLCCSLLLASLASAASSCIQDYDCGNPLYFDCVPNYPVCALINGVGVSYNNVYWFERCSTGTNSTVELKRAIGTKIDSVATVVENNSGNPNDESIVRTLLGANFRAVYFVMTGRFSNVLNGLPVKCDGFGPEFSSGFTRPGIPIDAAFDDNPDFFSSPFASYVCLGTQIVKYNKLIFNESDAYKLLYTADCTYISFYNNAIYWANVVYNSLNNTYQTAFYKGNTSCHNCSAPAPFASFGNNVNDFAIGNGRLYFARQNWGIQAVALGAPLSNATFLVASGNINALTFSNNKIYFNDGTTVRSIKPDTSNVQNISHITNSKKCQCASGFTGSDCNTCDGQVQTFNGQVSCVPYDPATGFPSRCILDKYCGNTTLTRCNQMLAKCECIAGTHAITPTCDMCTTGAVVWNNGVPSCPV